MSQVRRELWALGTCIVLAVTGLRGHDVPLLSMADLGFHELGHFISYGIDIVAPWPEALTAASGSIMQVLVPLGLAAYFGNLSDRAGAAVCLAWAGTSAASTARYIADAPFEDIPLLGGHHDWATVLGPEHLDRLGDAHRIAASVDRLGVVLLVIGVTLVVLRPAERLLGGRHAARV